MPWFVNRKRPDLTLIYGFVVLLCAVEFFVMWGFRTPFAPCYLILAFILAFCGSMMALRNARFLRTRKRLAAGLCPKCGYDLRGSKPSRAGKRWSPWPRTWVCPECGESC